MTPCSLNITTETLSAYYSHLLPAGDQAALETHIAHCAACQRHLAAYDAIRQALRQQRSPVDQHVVWRQLDARIAMTRGGFMQGTPRVAWLSGATVIVLLIVAFVAIFAMRQSHQTTPATSVSPTTTATASATATPSATATTIATATAPAAQPITAQQFAACFDAVGTNIAQADVKQVGDIAYGDFIGPFAYPARVLPDGAASPLKLTGGPATNFAPSFVGDADPFIDPSVHGANPYTAKFIVQICNLSTATTHHVSELGATINHFAPYTGSLNVWIAPPCVSTYYASASQKVVTNGGCGGSFPTDIQAAAAFPNNGGTTATDALTGDTALAPGAAVTVALTLTLPTTPGTSTLTPFLKIDGGSQDDGTSGTPSIYAPVAHLWDGKACANASIPASPAANYICRN